MHRVFDFLLTQERANQEGSVRDRIGEILPMPVMSCPHCRFDLTKRKADIERSSKEV